MQIRLAAKRTLLAAILPGFPKVVSHFYHSD